MDPLHLAAGPLRMVFDPELAFLRHVRMGDHEIVRGIYAAVRDRNWDTVPFVIDDLAVEQASERFAISFLARHRRDDVVAWPDHGVRIWDRAFPF
jgi:hypothetical protein